MEIADQIYDKLSRKGLDNIVVENVRENNSQVRFSRDSKDIFNLWVEDSTKVFVSRGKKTASSQIQDYSQVDNFVEKLLFMLEHTPENENFRGINPDKQDYSGVKLVKPGDEDIQELSKIMVGSALDEKADRVAGLIYKKHLNTVLVTSYNRVEYTTGGYEFLIRAFKGEMTGQESTHVGTDTSGLGTVASDLGKRAAQTASLVDSRSEGRSGKFKVLMSPYMIGNILSYGSPFFSAYTVEAGFSCFADMLNKPLGNSFLNVVDDPTDISGIGYRPVDDEGTVTSSKSLVEAGVLKRFLHSYSTASRSNTVTTGNAGIISPEAFQLKLLPGDSSEEEMLSSMDEGLYIRNAWYTRFQDYRNGIFSTVPRDGVFLVRNGEIAEAWVGIRISDSIPSILRNVEQISKESQNVKWWEEIFASNMPSVLVKDVTVTKAF